MGSSDSGEAPAIPLELARQVANFVLYHPAATVADVMAEFDLSESQANMGLALARLVLIVREHGEEV